LQTRFIYEDLVKKLLTPKRVLKYKNWVEKAQKKQEEQSVIFILFYGYRI